MTIQAKIRAIPDYPKPGILFRDITTLLQDPHGFHDTINALAKRYTNARIDKVAAIEARGFILGAPLAYALNAGFVPIRKKGKLPYDTLNHAYELEYGIDEIEIHTDAINEGEHVLLVDDLIATGGTANAAIQLIKGLGGNIVECCFIIDLPMLGGRDRLEQSGQCVYSMCIF